MARVNRVNKARKAQGSCGKCGTPILPGDPYIWTKPRYGFKKVRCIKPACRFRQSELTSSDKLARLYEAGETIYDSQASALAALDAFEGAASGQVQESLQLLADALEGLNTDIESQVEEVRSVSEEYQESADNILEYFTSGTELSEELENNSSEVEGWADELEEVASQVEEAFELASSLSLRAAARYLDGPQADDAAAEKAQERIEELQASAHDAISEADMQAGSCPL